MTTDTEYGTVEYKGKTYNLTDQAYPTDNPPDSLHGGQYTAPAVDATGNTYRVYWDTVEGWWDHKSGEDGDCVICGHLCTNEDESLACDWDNVASVEVR